MSGELLFIYNADSGLANALVDVGRRVFTPTAYPCDLCKITYGPFGMKGEWKQFVENLPYPVRFIHKDELTDDRARVAREFPALLLVQPDKVSAILTARQFKHIDSLEALQQAVTVALKTQLPA